MATNIKTYYKAGSGVVVTVPSPDITRVVAIHAATSAAGSFDLHDSSGASKIKFWVPGSATADIYIGELGIRFDGTVSASMPADAASLTLIVG
jgi:hypothetical protein